MQKYLKEVPFRTDPFACQVGNVVYAATEAGYQFVDNLGGIVDNIPLVSGMLGTVGDVVSGTMNASPGLATLGQSGTFMRGLVQIANGVTDASDIILSDVSATAMGVVGTIATTAIDLLEVATFGQIDSSFFYDNQATNPLNAIGRLLHHAVPDMGWYTGAAWGVSQGRNKATHLPFNALDHNSLAHDETGRHGQWVINNYSPIPQGVTPSGPISSSVVLLGTPLFGAAGLLQNLTNRGNP